MKEIGQRKNFLRSIGTFAGWGIGLISLGVTIYSEFIKKSEPRLEYDIVSFTQFINNNETSACLTILVDSIDVQNNHLNVSAYNIKVENKGTAHLRYDDYDEGRFGLQIHNARLLEPPTLVEASSEHIKTLFPKSESIKNIDFIDIPHISLDVEDYYVIRIVVLHDIDSIPFFSPKGKIVGQKDLSVNTLQAPSPGFWTEVLRGSWIIHIVRFILYIISLLIVTLIIAFCSFSLSDVIKGRRRKVFLKKLAKNKHISQNVQKDFINLGEGYICSINEMFRKPETALQKKYKTSKGFIDSQDRNAANEGEWLYHRRRYNTISDLIEKKYIVLRDDGSLSFNKEAKKSVREIYSMLLAKGFIKNGKDKDFFFYKDYMFLGLDL